MKWRILVVDDEPDVRMIIRTTLEPKYEVVEAHDGLDALEKLERAEPDFVLMDVMMPLMNGHEACAAIRKNPRFSKVPVMFLSALGSKDDIKKGYGMGANMYLTKPFDPPRLLRNIDMFMESTPPARQHRRYSIDDLKRAEHEGREPISPGAAEWDASSTHTSTTAPRIPTSSLGRPSHSQAEVPQLHSSHSGEAHRPDAHALDPSIPGLLPRVMVVDDDPEIVQLMHLSLEGITEVVSAGDGIQAIERLVKYQPDILVIDIMLPKMNGFQLCQSLRANRAFARLPIMMCSAKGADRDKLFAKRLGANDYLVKPFSPSELITRVREMQKLPGFRVRPKSYTIDQIRDMEGVAMNPDVFNAGDDLRGAPAEQMKQTQNAIGQFLSREGDKDALEHTEQPKPKRTFFGFGKDK